MDKELLETISIEAFKRYYHQLLIDEEVNFIASFFASRRVERFSSIEEVFAYAHSKPYSRSSRALALYKQEQAEKTNVSQSDFLPTSQTLFGYNLVSLSEQKKVLIQKLKCDEKALICLQRRSDTGSVWRYDDCVYKIFAKGCSGRSALEQARFESNAWNEFYGLFSSRYASSFVEIIENIPVMKTPYISGVLANREESLEIGIRYASNKKQKLTDLTKPGNCLKTPDNKVYIVDFGEKVSMSDKDAMAYVSCLESELKQFRGEFETESSSDFFDCRFMVSGF